MFPRFDEALFIKIHAVEFLVDNVEESWNLLDPIIQKRKDYKNYLLGRMSKLIFGHIQFFRFFIYIL